jgi:hypothetical protein
VAAVPLLLEVVEVEEAVVQGAADVADDAVEQGGLDQVGQLVDGPAEAVAAVDREGVGPAARLAPAAAEAAGLEVLAEVAGQGAVGVADACGGEGAFPRSLVDQSAAALD